MTRYLTGARFGLRGAGVIGLLIFVGLLAVACSATGGYGSYGSTAPTQAPAVAGATPVAPPAAAAAPSATAAPAAPAASSSGTSSGGGQDVQATLTEFTITLSTPTLKAGHVRFNVQNTGKFNHALEIAGQGIDKKTDNLSAGQSGTLDVDLTPGSYQVWCPVSNHKDRGMLTTITVQ